MAALAMYASGIAPGRNTCPTGLTPRQTSLFAAIMPSSVNRIRPASASSARHQCATPDPPSRGRSTMHPGRECRRGQPRHLTPPPALPEARAAQEARTVSGPTTTRTQEVPIPEPDLTPEAIIGRARALIPAVRAQQEEAERLGHHPP